jgi:hypothetical protein
VQLETATAIRIAIFDMWGRLLKQWAPGKLAQYGATLPIADLSAGNYILQVRSSTFNAQQQFSVVR